MIGIEWGNVLVLTLGCCTIVFCANVFADSFVRVVYALNPSNCDTCDNCIECKKQIEALSFTVGKLERLTNELVKAEELRVAKARGEENG